MSERAYLAFKETEMGSLVNENQEEGENDVIGHFLAASGEVTLDINGTYGTIGSEIAVSVMRVLRRFRDEVSGSWCDTDCGPTSEPGASKYEVRDGKIVESHTVWSEWTEFLTR